ncbi:MAG: alpha/beta hydrolase family protein [Acidimicrobiia bacterium]
MKRLVALTALATLLLAVISTWVHLELPALSGPHAVGRLERVWLDHGRPESHTADDTDHRQVGVVLWYPAVDGSDPPASYIPNEDEMMGALAASGEVNPIAAYGLHWVQGHAFQDAEIDQSQSKYPVVLLSPGNATNVEFYGSMAEDLASNGYIVVGVNHPYQVPATRLENGEMALFREDLEVPAKIEERIFDLRFVIDRLEQEAKSGAFLEGRLDFDALGVMGHSNGGLAAVELCKDDQRVQACLNIDGQAAGGAFGTSPDDQVPAQSFMFLTKEVTLHPELASRFEAGRAGGYRVVIPAATHDGFADGALFAPSLWPFARTADKVNEVTRGFVNAFFDLALRGEPRTVLGGVSASTDVYVYVYPLERT